MRNNGRDRDSNGPIPCNCSEVHVSDTTLDAAAPQMAPPYMTPPPSSFAPQYTGPGCIVVSTSDGPAPAPPTADKKEGKSHTVTVGVVAALAGIVCGAGLAYAFMGQSNNVRSSSLHQPLIQGSKGQDL